MVGLSLLLSAAACAQPGREAAGAVAPGTYASDAAAIRVEHTGGFRHPSALVTRLPIVAVYGDGRVITQGPVPDIYPGPALPNVQVAQVSRADVHRLVTAAVAAGVGGDLDFGEPPIADASSTRFTVRTDTGAKITEVYALGEDVGGDAGLTDAQRSARRSMRDLLAALTDLPTTLGAGAVGETRPYGPTGLVAVATLWTDPGDGIKPAELAWPGPALPGESAFAGLDLGCVAVTGAQSAAVLAAAAKATSITPWTSNGRRWMVGLRPLLPDETTCADLQPAS